MFKRVEERVELSNVGERGTQQNTKEADMCKAVERSRGEDAKEMISKAEGHENKKTQRCGIKNRRRRKAWRRERTRCRNGRRRRGERSVKINFDYK
jgi:hypothetical protein